MIWVVCTVGEEHIRSSYEINDEESTYILREHSPIRKYGKQLGFPAAYHEWLCVENRAGIEILLTLDFFLSEV